MLLQALYLLKTIANSVDIAPYCGNLTGHVATAHGVSGGHFVSSAISTTSSSVQQANQTSSSQIDIYALLLRIMRSNDPLVANTACEIVCYTLHHEKSTFEAEKADFFMQTHGIVAKVLENMCKAKNESLFYSSCCAISIFIEKLPLGEIRSLLVSYNLLSILTRFLQHSFMNVNPYTFPKLTILCKCIYKLLLRVNGKLTVSDRCTQLFVEYAAEEKCDGLRDYAAKILSVLKANGVGADGGAVGGVAIDSTAAERAVNNAGDLAARSEAIDRTVGGVISVSSRAAMVTPLKQQEEEAVMGAVVSVVNAAIVCEELLCQ